MPFSFSIDTIKEGAQNGSGIERAARRAADSLPFVTAPSDALCASGDKQILKLEGVLTVRDAHDMAVRLREGLEEGAVIGIDTEGLEDSDTCILQLLCSLRKSVPAVSFNEPSEAFLRAVDRCGLRRELLGTRDNA
jgi:anti-anti-sigma regulatory factor